MRDAQGNPISNLPVTLFSDPKKATTDENGYAAFHDVEIGRHTLQFSYQDKNQKYAVAISEPKTTQGEVQVEIVEVQLKKKGDEWIYISVISALVAIIGFLAIKRRQSKLKTA